MKKIVSIALSLAVATTTTAQTILPFQNPQLSADERADDLISRLTLEEKASLMMHQSPAIPRLGVPVFQWWNEALHGVARNGTATVFPITMNMAAAWNEDLLYKVYNAVSDEGRAKAQVAKQSGNVRQYQGLSFWTPNVNIFRDPRWGRGQETYGEDPYLTARMGVAVVKGLQGPDDAKYRKSLACAKHFAVHSGPEWNRHSFNIDGLPERELWETYLPAFKALIQEAGVEEVMCAYQSMEGEPCCGNNRYLQQILRGDLGFKGLVTSDCWALNDFFNATAHAILPGEIETTGMAVRAGTDLECGSVYKSIPEAVKAGQLTEDKVNESLKRLIMARIKLGDFDPDDMVEWTKIPASVIGCREHVELAQEIAEQGIVLLQNRGDILPLRKSGQRIAVLGPNAADSTMLWGNYNGTPRHTVTILDGMQALSREIEYIPGCGHVENTMQESRFSAFYAPDGRLGMKATYFNNERLEGEPVATTYNTTPLHFDNGGATAFAQGVNLEHFSARYEGVLRCPKTESLTLAVEANDAVRIIVDGDTIYNTWNTSARSLFMRRPRPIRVNAGDNKRFVIEYMQRENEAQLHFDITAMGNLTADDIVRKASNADVVVYVGGISPRLEGEEMRVNADGFKGGDRTNIDLPKVQKDILRSLHAMGKRIVFVNCSGSAMALADEAEWCDAIVQAWYGGERGGTALARVLFGDVNPSGKLPITFYRSTDQLPDFLDYTMRGRTYRFMDDKPLFAFGHGLSYTTFLLGKAKYNIKKGTVTLNVSNTGTRDGSEVVQVYLRKLGDSDGPRKTLRAYKRVTLKAGETQTVTIPLPRQQFEWWDAETNAMRIVPGKYEIMVGNSSDNAPVVQTIVVK